jgi:hypothetical protein
VLKYLADKLPITETWGENVNYKLIPVLLLAVVALIGTPMAAAKSSYLTSFNQHYDTGSTKLDSCVICHSGQSGGSLNLYGRAYSGSGRNFTSLEAFDVDEDGYTNLEEINALTFPGNPDDYPQPTLETPSETTLNVTEPPINENQEQQTTEIPISNTTPEQPATELPMSNETQGEKSPGFDIILGVMGLLAVFSLRRCT